MFEIKEINLSRPDDVALGVAKLYVSAGWAESAELEAESVSSALQNTYCAYGAYKGDCLAGFVRALCDGVGDAFIIDFVVAPEFRKRGIGSSLAKAIIARLKSEEINWITAIAEPDSKSIFMKLGAKMDDCTPVRF